MTFIFGAQIIPSEFTGIAQFITEFRSVILLGLVVLFVLLVRQIWRAQRTPIRKELDRTKKFVKDLFNGDKHEAILNRVVCHHCRRGRGILNPNYRQINGEPHVEGACSSCGGHLSVPIRS